MVTPNSPTWSMADQLLDGKLARYLTRLADQGLTGEAIAKRLFAEHRVDISSFTIRDWLKKLNGDERAS